MQLLVYPLSNECNRHSGIYTSPSFQSFGAKVPAGDGEDPERQEIDAEDLVLEILVKRSVVMLCDRRHRMYRGRRF